MDGRLRHRHLPRHEKRCYAYAFWLWISLNFHNFFGQDKAKNTPLHKFEFTNTLFMAKVTFYFICWDICLLVWMIFCILCFPQSAAFSTILDDQDRHFLSCLHLPWYFSTKLQGFRCLREKTASGKIRIQSPFENKNSSHLFHLMTYVMIGNIRVRADTVVTTQGEPVTPSPDILSNTSLPPRYRVTPSRNNGDIFAVQI